jgi:transposase-like protein
MEFIPPRCPNRTCEQHARPVGRFFVRRGRYHVRCRDYPIPRFACLTCDKTFSRQTFRHDRGDRRPDSNERLFELLASGVGLRQCGRLLKLDIHSVVRKKHKIARTCAQLHTTLSRRLPAGRTYLLDEEETYEGASIRPLTMPVLIEKDTWFVVATAVGPIRRLAPPGSHRRAMQEADERRHGRRPDTSNRCVTAVLERLAGKLGNGSLLLRTDKKASYGRIAKNVFGDRVVHETTPGTQIRTAYNPLFPINTTLAMTRDNCGRLRRRSWLVTKRARCLQEHLALFVVYRNYVRPRFNRDLPQSTPGRLLRLLPRPLIPAEVIAWRQDWGERSIHPMCYRADRTFQAILA